MLIRRFVLFSFLVALLIDGLKHSNLLPLILRLSPEIISALCFLLVFFAIGAKRTIDVRPVFVVLGTLILTHIFCGVLVNQLNTGVVFAGLRTYLKYLPFFILPMIFRFEGKDLVSQFKFILAFTLLQLPVTVYQRFVVSADVATGDRVGGTMGISSHLSIYLICFSSILVGAYLNKKLKLKEFLVLLALTLVPTTLNETKGTWILLPFALFLPVLLNVKDSHRFKHLLGIGLAGVVFLVVYVPIYDSFRPEKPSILSYWNIETLKNRLAPQTTDHHEHLVGRIDVMIMPIGEFKDDAVKLFFGLGMGNTADSKLGEDFAGEYFEEYNHFAYLAVAHLQWELGLFGLILVLTLGALIAMEAYKLVTRDDALGTLALGWMGVSGVLFVAMFYKNTIEASPISYLFWFYSGVILSEVARSHTTIEHKLTRNGDNRWVGTRNV